MSVAMPSLIAVGPWQFAEFQAVRDAIDPQGEWPTVATLAEVLPRLEAAGAPPELILLAQPRPVVDDAGLLEELRRAAPLTRVIVVAGAWCEGELRTGRPLPGVVRLYWYEFAPWWRAAAEEIARGGTPAWSAPLDDPRAGQASAIDPSAVESRERGMVAVDAVDFAVFETLAAALAPWGWGSAWTPRHRPELFQTGEPTVPPVAGIWDGGQLSENELASLAAFAARLQRTNDGERDADRRPPVIALLDFPRVEHLAAVQHAGGAAILAKPYQVAHLANELERLVVQRLPNFER